MFLQSKILANVTIVKLFLHKVRNQRIYHIWTKYAGCLDQLWASSLAQRIKHAFYLNLLWQNLHILIWEIMHDWLNTVYNIKGINK